MEHYRQPVSGKDDKVLEKRNAWMIESASGNNIPSQTKQSGSSALKLDKAMRLAKQRTNEGCLEQAKLIYQDILAKFPKNKRAQQSLRALTKLEPSAVSQHPYKENIDQLTNFYNQGNYLAVIEFAEILTQKYPQTFDVWNYMGAANKGLGRILEASKAFKKVTELNPNYAEGYNNMGVVLRQQGELEAALKAYKKALLLKPNFAEVYYNLGTVLIELGHLEEAIEIYEKGLSIKPDYAEAYNNIGIALKNQGKFDEAIEAYKKAISVKPDYATAHLNLSFAFLNNGNWKKGLDEYEWRWETTNNFHQRRYFQQPMWDGKKTLKDKTILVWGEQGPQDMIIWSSAMEYLSSLANHCIFECPEKLVSLFSRSLPNITVEAEKRSSDHNRDDFDFHIPIGSLFKCFFSKISERKKCGPLLKADMKRVNYWTTRLSSLGAGPFVGISWKSPVMSIDRLPNYTDIINWEAVLSIPNITFINLQSTDFKNDLRWVQDNFGVKVHNFEDLDHYDNLDDVAALCKALDICISVSTAVGAIASGVGTSTKILSWKQSPWNNFLLAPCGPSVHTYQRNTWDPWNIVLGQVANDLKTDYFTDTRQGLL